MQIDTQNKNRNVAWVVAGLAVAGSLTLSCSGKADNASNPLPAPAQSVSADGWLTDKDAARGFLVTHPAGWTVHADGHSILIQSQNHSQSVLAEGFNASPGETAQAHLTTLAEERATLFPDAQMIDLTHQRSAGDEVSGVFSYRATPEMGRGRVLCSIVNGKGLVFVLAAPEKSFAAAQLTLTRIVQSLRFTVPTGSAASKGQSEAAQMAAVTQSLHFVPWTDPREHAFQMEVPEGWKVEGGAFRFGPTDVRIAYEVISPDNAMSVLVGDPRLPSTFQAPNAFTQRMHWRDGTHGLLHYMSAVEFNHWYLEHTADKVLDNLSVGQDHPLPEVSRQQTAVAQQSAIGAAQVEVSVGITEFSGRSKETGEQVTCIIIGSTQRTTRNMRTGEMTSWFARPVILSCNNDADKSRSQQTTFAVLTHMLQTYHEDPVWLNRRAREIAQATGQAMQRTADRSRQITKNSEAARSASMGAYWGRVNADNERQRGFINYIGDRTDVTDGSGASANVQGGSKHYYKNGQTGTIIGTDSAYSPGVDFSPLTEH